MRKNEMIALVLYTLVATAMVCVTAVSAPAAASGLPAKPYLAFFPGRVVLLSAIDQHTLKMLDNSPYDGMTVVLRSAYSVDPFPTAESLRAQIKAARKGTHKDLWPVVHLSRMMGARTPPPGAGPVARIPPDPEPFLTGLNPEFYKIRGLDVTNERGALAAFESDWREALRIAKALGSPGICYDPEAYDDQMNYHLLKAARLRGEEPQALEARLEAIGGEPADITGREFPDAVIWALFSFCEHQPERDAQGRAYPNPPACILRGLLKHAKERKIPLTVVDGGETAVGYSQKNLEMLERALHAQQQQQQDLLARFPQFVLGATIAPFLDDAHRAAWMPKPKATEQKEVEDFEPYVRLLLERRRFVWIYAASSNGAYDPWDPVYAARVNPGAREGSLPPLLLPLCFPRLCGSLVRGSGQRLLLDLVAEPGSPGLPGCRTGGPAPGDGRVIRRAQRVRAVPTRVDAEARLARRLGGGYGSAREKRDDPRQPD